MARERGVTYVKLDGEVGILGNGAGLVMSTLDVVAQAGGRAANFLDVGGGAQAEEIVSALEVILSDTKVRSILFNIFGGITRCDEVARGHPRRARPPRRAGADRRAARRHVRRGGAQAPARREPTEPDRRAHDARRGAARRRARREGGVDGHRRRPPRRVSSCRASRAARARSTRSATATTARRSSPGSRRARAASTVEGVPVYDTVAEAVEREGANTSMVFVPPRFAADAIYEAASAGVQHRRLHHRGHPGPRDARRLLVRARTRRAPARPELPGRALSRHRERRHHPDARLQARPDRARLALRHAHVPDRQRAGPGRCRATRRSSASVAIRSWARASSTSSSSSRPTPTPSSS